MINSYKDLIVWQKSLELTTEIYKITSKFPKEEIYGLVSQMRRAAVSIPSNISEGRNRGTKKDFVQFLRIAYGSGAELETQLVLALKLNFTNNASIQKADKLLDETMRMLNVMIKRLTANS